MELKRFVMGLLAACAFVGLPMTQVSAAPITFELDTEFSGGTAPAGPAPWVTATFEDLIGGGVQLTINALNLTGTEFISEFNFNFNPVKNAASNLGATPGTGTQTAWESRGAGNDAFKAGPDGWVDFYIEFPTSGATPADRFTAGETFVFTWAGLTAADFNFASVNKSGSADKAGFFAVAHVQSIGTSGGSGWIGDGDGGGGTTRVPEPGTLALLGLSLTGLAIARRRKQ